MGFLDNSGDIILDAVLTDAGRRRISMGSGEFSIAKFALGDDEIDYGLYDKNNANGSAYYDTTILQTPILEAFTNNTSLLKSKLMSINRNNIFNLPVLKLFTTAGKGSAMHSSGLFVLAVDKATVDNLDTLSAGILNGYKPNDDVSHIRVDQGIDSVPPSPEDEIPTDLLETQYIVEVDNRFAAIFPPPDATTTRSMSTNTSIPSATPSFVDDDSIASYYFSFSGRGASSYVTNVGGTQESSIAGPRGTKVKLRLGSTLDTRTSDYLFTQIGTLSTTAFSNPAGNPLDAGTWRYLDTTVRVTGVNTGYRIDIPVRLIKSV